MVLTEGAQRLITLIPEAIARYVEPQAGIKRLPQITGSHTWQGITAKNGGRYSTGCLINRRYTLGMLTRNVCYSNHHHSIHISHAFPF